MKVGIPVVLKDSKIWKTKDGRGRCEASTFFLCGDGTARQICLRLSGLAMVLYRTSEFVRSNQEKGRNVGNT